MRLATLLDADLEQLLGFSYSISEPAKDLATYREALIYYLTGETGALALLLEDPKHSQFLRLLMELRLKIRTKNIKDEDLLQYASGLASAPMEWRGEIYFILSILAADLNRHAEFEKYSKNAATELECIGARKKSIKALLNVVVAKSRLQVKRHFIPDYIFIFRKARAAKAFDSAGICLQNIAKEYHDLGAHTSALTYANRAVSLLSRTHCSYNFYLSLMQRAYIFLSLGRTSDAYRDVDAARAAPFHEIASAIKIFESKRRVNADQQLELSHITPAWRERAEGKLPVHRLGFLEQSLVRFLSNGPLTRYELIEKLYGSKIDVLAAENRLKNLLGRLRRRKPGLVINQDGRYYLAEPDIDGVAS